MIAHGGRLREAAARYGISLSDWLDLSTGINPDGYPVTMPQPSAWARLPEEEDGLLTVATDYYGTDSLLAVSGSQAAIQALPRLREACDVGVISPGYAEHAYGWRRAGHRVQSVTVDQIDLAVSTCDVVVLIHPNNPTGDCFETEQLLDWRERLAARGGWLIVDEAFIDATPDKSLACFSLQPGLILLRSIGKFFGLAGARVGFVLAETALLRALREELGPWPLAGPSRAAAAQALADQSWQATARVRLAEQSRQLTSVLTKHGLAPTGGCALFQWVCTPDAAVRHIQLARHGVLTRLFDSPASLRFGLPGNDENVMRLDRALANVCSV